MPLPLSPSPQLVCKHLFLYPLHWRHPFKLLELAGVPLELLPRNLPSEDTHTFFKAGVSVFLDHTLLMYGDQGQLQELCDLMLQGRSKYGGWSEDRGESEGRGRLAVVFDINGTATEHWKQVLPAMFILCSRSGRGCGLLLLRDAVCGLGDFTGCICLL